MKKLIFLGILVTSIVQADNAPEIIDRNQTNQIVTRIKDVEIGNQLQQSSQFVECRKDYDIGKMKSDTERQAALKKATDCLKGKLSNAGPDQLKKLSEELQLQQYGLVPSNNVKDIQNYLTDKMEKALTGVDPKDIREATDRKKYFDLLKKKKLVDQSVFIQLYKTQVGKNALFEISRFCFENLRADNSDKAKQSFSEYWNKNSALLDDPKKLTDVGDPSFSNDLVSSDEKDKNKIYENIFNHIQDKDHPLPPSFLDSFFQKCGQAIVPLCKDFKDDKTVKDSISNNNSAVDDKGKLSSTTRGAVACLTQSRLIEYRSALANADKIIKQMTDDERNLPGVALQIERGTPIAVFDQNQQGSSLDDLTSQSSTDMFAGNNLANQKDDCDKNPEVPACEKYYTKGEDYVKVQEKVEREMTFQREVELARVKELVKTRDQKLDDYLKENGFFDILNDPKYKDKTMTDADIENSITQAFEAKKLAALQEIQARIGKRQLSDADKGDQSKEKAVVDQGIEDSKSERARLAQVVLFNNIITSHLKLQKKDSSGQLQDAGRNTKGWQNEEQGLKTANINPDLFKNLKTQGSGSSGGPAGNEQLSGFDLIDTLLGDTSKK